jgi:hypothetical protein
MQRRTATPSDWKTSDHFWQIVLQEILTYEGEMKPLLGFAAGLMFGLFLDGSLAHAHGAAAWIMADPDTRFCCGRSDCLVLPDGAVKHLESGGYAINDEWFPEVGGVRPNEMTSRVFPSNDAHYWACFHTWTAAAGYGRQADVETEWQHLPVRCLFVPSIGM